MTDEIDWKARAEIDIELARAQQHSAEAEVWRMREALRASRAEVRKLREALEWYAEQAEWCRKIRSRGDPARHALDNDGGKRARAALSPAPDSGENTEARMTDIIEARERALCWLKHTQSKGWCRCVSADACLPTMREMFRDQVAATLAADRAAGYWLAPMEPSMEILEAMWCALFTDPWTAEQAPMIGAAYDAAMRTACKEDNDAK